jgi:hypothetical protein
LLKINPLKRARLPTPTSAEVRGCVLLSAYTVTVVGLLTRGKGPGVAWMTGIKS